MMDNILITKKAISAADMLADYEEHKTSDVFRMKVQHIAVYPNPTNGVLYLNMSNIGEPVTVEVMNLVGAVVKSQKITNPGNVEQLNLGELKNGMYFLVITYKRQKHIKTFVKTGN